MTQEIIDKYPNDYELGNYIRLKHSDFPFVKQIPNNFDLGSYVRKMVYEKIKKENEKSN